MHITKLSTYTVALDDAEAEGLDDGLRKLLAATQNLSGHDARREDWAAVSNFRDELTEARHDA
jgi:hypothetical protein